jgi:hypothetical protein
MILDGGALLLYDRSAAAELRCGRLGARRIRREIPSKLRASLRRCAPPFLRQGKLDDGQGRICAAEELLVISEAVSVSMAGDDQGHHVFEVEFEAFQGDFFVHVFDFPVGFLAELLKFGFTAEMFFEEVAVFLVRFDQCLANILRRFRHRSPPGQIGRTSTVTNITAWLWKPRGKIFHRSARGEEFPQRLKPHFFFGGGGTSEAVTYKSSSLWADFGGSGRKPELRCLILLEVQEGSRRMRARGNITEGIVFGGAEAPPFLLHVAGWIRRRNRVDALSG